MLQYEWIQPGVDASHSNAVNSPGPTTPHIEWRTRIPNLAGQPVAFNGKIFITDVSLYAALPGQNRTMYCIDAATGEIIYKLNLGPVIYAAVPTPASICKLDNTYMLIGSNCYKIADGSLVWTGPSGFSYGQTIYSGMGYDPDLKCLISGSRCWSLADPSQPPKLLWDRATEADYGKYGSESPKCYGSGVVVYTTSYYYIRGVNVTTGKTIWTTATDVTSWSYGAACIDGVFGFGALDGNFRGWNLTTGKLMWTYNPGTFYNEWASGPGAAYGMFFEHNQDAYVYAINATTGKLVWSYKGPGIAYSNSLTIAGGRVYIQMGENQYADFATGAPGHSEFDCFDAYTGKLIWSMPFENGSPFNLQCNAYGKLFVVPTVSSYTPGVFTYTGFAETLAGPGELWCIGDTPQDWPMFLNDPAHSSFGDGPTHLALKWKATTGGAIVSSPTLAKGVAYVGSYDGNIYAFNANTGAQIWNYSIGKIGFSSTLAVVNGKLYTGPDDGNVYCLDATTGNKLWQAVATIGSGSPTVTGGMVYVAGGSTLYCFNANSGVKVWNFSAGGAIPGAPTVADGAVYISANGIAGDEGFHVIKLNATTGALIYNVVLPGFVGGFSVPTSTTAPLTVGDGMVFARGTSRYNYALNATSGAIIWMTKSGFNEGSPFQTNGPTLAPAMLYANNLVYITDYYSITALNALNGSKVWSTYTSRESLSLGFGYSYGRVYTTNEAGTLYVLDALSGAKLSFYQFGGATLHSVPTPYNGSLYVSSMDWNLYCFDEAKAPAVVTTALSLSLSANRIEKGDDIYIVGGVSPINYAVPVTLTLDKPDSTYVDIPVMTDENGNFMVIQTFDIVGDWKVVAWWNGDDFHTSAYSESLSLTVVEPEAMPPPAYPQPIDPTWTIVAIGIAIIIAVAVVGVWIKKK
jgi:outer membrane protein assembly factor BamB